MKVLSLIKLKCRSKLWEEYSGVFQGLRTGFHNAPITQMQKDACSKSSFEIVFILIVSLFLHSSHFVFVNISLLNFIVVFLFLFAGGAQPRCITLLSTLSLCICLAAFWIVTCCVLWGIQSTGWSCRCATNTITTAMAMMCAINFRFETLAANCSTVPFTPTTWLDMFSRTLKTCSFLKSMFSMATLLVLRNLIGYYLGKVVHIVCTIVFS